VSQKVATGGWGVCGGGLPGISPGIRIGVCTRASEFKWDRVKGLLGN
jgi:hypothetical protein